MPEEEQADQLPHLFILHFLIFGMAPMMLLYVLQVEKKKNVLVYYSSSSSISSWARRCISAQSGDPSSNMARVK